jgi:hypothetical protein
MSASADADLTTLKARNGAGLRRRFLMETIMRELLIPAGALLLTAIGLCGVAWADGDSGDDPLSVYSAPELPDPVPFKGVPMAAGTATATVAATSQARNAAARDGSCNALNPCAMATPANATAKPANR